jgi:trans-feruloyl-CoA hydratase/vanillin synthase
MDFQTAAHYLDTKGTLASVTDPEKSRQRGIAQFLDSKSYRPGFRGVQLDEAGAESSEPAGATSKSGG